MQQQNMSAFKNVRRQWKTTNYERNSCSAANVSAKHSYLLSCNSPVHLKKNLIYKLETASTVQEDLAFGIRNKRLKPVDKISNGKLQQKYDLIRK